jgi:hypothetical protein
MVGRLLTDKSWRQQQLAIERAVRRRILSVQSACGTL